MMSNQVTSMKDAEKVEKELPDPELKKILKFIPPDKLDRLCSMSFTIRIGISPIYGMMQLCGLTYGSPCPMVTHIGLKHKLQRFYTVIVAVVVLIGLLRLIPVLCQDTPAYPKFIKYEYFLWSVKCVVQAYFCIFISCRYGRPISRLQTLIHDYDLQFERYRTACDPKARRRFKRKCKVIKYILFASIAVTIISNFISAFTPVFYQNKIANGLFEPIKNPSLPVKLVIILGLSYHTVAWLLPVLLYCAICLSLCLIFDQFLASLSKSECNKISKRIDYIREEYRLLERLVTRTDETFGFIALCVYSMDVALSCFHMYHICYFADGPLMAFPPGYRLFVSLANLFFISLCASMIVDKGQSISNYVASMSAENVDLESHAQLVMLLHEITINPIALTIWKLVPLYKSIVISVFVSLITYFTLLIQFKS